MDKTNLINCWNYIKDFCLNSENLSNTKKRKLDAYIEVINDYILGGNNEELNYISKTKERFKYKRNV